jgi:signal transduction histidine kinase
MRLEKALLASQLRIQELEKDRDQTKCDIHDGVLQSLYAVGLGLKSCALLLHDAPSRVTEQLKRSTVQLDQALRELRSFLNNGHAKELDGEEDLDRALPALVQAMTGLSSVHCRLTIDPAAIACIPKEQQKDILNRPLRYRYRSLSKTAGRAFKSVMTESGSCRIIRPSLGWGYGASPRELQA